MSNNTTSYDATHGIKSDTLRYLWAGYYAFIVTSSWIGDTTILIGSIKYNAFKLHKVIVVIIQHIAVCDLMLSTGTDLMRLISVFAGKWVFGTFLCQWFNHIEYYLKSASILLICTMTTCTMTTCKVLILKYPLRFRCVSQKRAYLLCGSCWALSFTIPVAMLLVDANDVQILSTSYVCAYGFSSNIWLFLKPILAFAFLFAPVCLVMVTSIYLLVIAKRVAHRGKENLNWQGIMVTIVTAIVFCISFLPFFVFLLVESILGDNFSSLGVYGHIKRAAVSFYSLNVISNFYIYSLTVDSFRSFVLSRLQLFFQRIRVRKCCIDKETCPQYTTQSKSPSPPLADFLNDLKD